MSSIMVRGGLQPISLLIINDNPLFQLTIFDHYIKILLVAKNF